MAYKTFNTGDVLTAGDLNNYLMRQSVIVCTSSSRPSPVDGMVIHETDTTLTLQRVAGVWRRIPRDSESGGPWEASEATNDTSTSTTAYVAGSVQHGLAFTAPPSGKVTVSLSASLGTNGVAATVSAYLSFEVRTGSTVGSGTLTLAPSDNRSPGLYRPNNAASGFKYAPGSLRILVSGLTPDSPYNVRSMFRTDTTTSTVAVVNRYLLVEAVM